MDFRIILWGSRFLFSRCDLRAPGQHILITILFLLVHDSTSFVFFFAFVFFEKKKKIQQKNFTHNIGLPLVSSVCVTGSDDAGQPT